MPLNGMMAKALKKIALGDTLLPQEFTLGLPDPQTEIISSLHGPGIDRDVTNHLSTACAAPMTLCIGFDAGTSPSQHLRSALKLRFSRRDNPNSLLGEIGLRPTHAISAGPAEFLFFEPRNSSNHCLPPARMGLHYLLHAWRQWRRDNTQGMKMTFLERRASMVTFIRPHPILLTSVGSKENGNIFPMNLCGDLGNGYFGFALRTERVAGTLVQEAGHVAISSVPEEEGYLAYRMAGHHTKQTIDWEQLPFATKPSKKFHIPVPEFAQRVRELEVETSVAIGTHRFFIARIVEDQRFCEGPGFCSIHGFYQYWRLHDLADRNAILASSRTRDAFHKRERHPSPSIK